MGWSNAFIASLDASSITPIYTLEVVRVPLGVGDPTFIYSDRGSLQIGRSGVEIKGTSVIPQRWSVSFGGFELELVGDIRPYRKSLIRGALCVLRVSLAGLSDERIAIGQLDQLSGLRGNYRAVFKDFLSASQSRFDNRFSGGKGLSRFFYDTETSTTVATNFTVGDTALRVIDSTVFTKPFVDGVLYCIPSSGQPYFMRWSSKNDATSTLTVSGQASHPSTVSASNLLAGDTLFNAARILAAPYAVFAQLITSTGNGTNGVDDKLPSSYGNGAPLHYSFFDRADAALSQDYIKPSSGSYYQWDLNFNEPLEGGMRSIMDLASNVGQFPVMRQNSFSWRGCSDPTGKYGDKPATSAHIRDDDITRFNSVEFFDGTLRAPFLQIQLFHNAGNTVSSVVTNTNAKNLPVAVNKSRSFGDYYDQSGGNASSMASGDLKRMQIWDFYQWSRVSINVKLKYSVLCAGDIVQLTSNYIVDLETTVTGGFVGRFGMIISMSYNITRRSCNLVIAFPPVL